MDKDMETDTGTGLSAEPEIRRRPDGSIDTAHYMSRGLTARSRQAVSLRRTVWTWMTRRWSAPAEAAVAPPRAGSLTPREAGPGAERASRTARERRPSAMTGRHDLRVSRA